MRLKTYIPFYLLTFSVLVFLVLPFLVQEGMFMDGQQYACVSKNFADGKASFWFPVLSKTWMMQSSPYFMEHPPLFYGVESWFFKLFGSSIYTERIFSFSMLFLCALFMHLIWQLISTHYGQNKYNSWFPILLWIITPVCFWTFQNHMIETLLSVFTLAAVFFALKAVSQKQKHFFYLLLSAILIFCGFLTKGLPGLFPLATIPAFYLSTKQISLKQTIRYTAFILTTLIIIYLIIIFTSADAKESLNFYLTKRLLNRIDETSTINNRFSILFYLLMEFLPSLLICLVLYFLSKKAIAQQLFKNEDKKLFYFMLLMGCSASVPLTFTMVQKNFYLVPAIPFFALALSYINTGFLDRKISVLALNDKSVKILTVIGINSLIGVLTFSAMQIGKISRDKELINEVKIIGNFLKCEELVSVDDDTYMSWSFQFYILRYYNIQLQANHGFRKYYITRTAPEVNSDYQYTRVNLPTNEYKLYRLNKPD